MSGKVTDDLLQQINDPFNSRDVDRIMSFFIGDCTFRTARGPERDERRVDGKGDAGEVLNHRGYDRYEFRKIPTKDTYWKRITS